LKSTRASSCHRQGRGVNDPYDLTASHGRPPRRVRPQKFRFALPGFDLQPISARSKECSPANHQSSRGEHENDQQCESEYLHACPV
jgi:hypothetical protein